MQECILVACRGVEEKLQWSQRDPAIILSRSEKQT